MLKKIASAALAAAMVLSLAVMPVHASTFYNTGTFSSANWAQYEQGFYTSTSDFSENFKEYTDTSYGTDRLTAVRMVATSTKTLSDKRNPVAYKFGQSLSDYGVHENDSAAYAHMRVYLATFSDEWRNCFDEFQLRIDKQGDGSSRDTFIFYTKKPEGSDSYVSEAYPYNYTNSAAYITRDWFVLKQGKGGRDFGNTANNSSSVLSDSDYDKIDIITELGKQNGCTTYLFANGKFMGCAYDSGLNVNKHFHGIVFRVIGGKKTRGNSDYIAVKMDPNRIGHREYYNTSDYMVTFEDVLQDAGLGDAISNPKVIYKTSDIQSFMPGDDQIAYTYYKDASERVRFNEGVTYSGNTATISATNDTESYSIAARMLAGMYPLSGKTGVSYESYHPRSRFIKFSFDQTISDDGMWLEYATVLNYGSNTQAIQMWNNGGYLVAGVKGGGNITCNGNGGKPLAEMTGTNHIDWILEPVNTYENGEESGHINQYVYINGTLAASGEFGSKSSVRLNDIVLSTKNREGTVTIDNWSMTVYNNNMSYSDFEADFEAAKGNNIYWLGDSAEIGVERGYTTAYEDMNDYFALYVTAKDTGLSVIPSGTKLYTAIYDGDYNLLDISETPYVSGQTVMDETEGKLFYRRYDGVKPTKAKIFVWTDGEPQGVLKSCTIDPDSNTLN